MNQIRKSVEAGRRSFHNYRSRQEGKIGYILLWLIGVPVPILFAIYLLRGCS